MKARIYYGRGQWWCRRLGVTGSGATPAEAWFDMWALYGQFIRETVPKPYYSPRSG